MIFKPATPLLAGCVVGASADVNAAASVDVAAASSQKFTEDLIPDATIESERPRAHRLLQKFKNRRRLAAQNESGGTEMDLGILSKTSDTPRFLQDDYDYYCPRETCPSELCDCADSGGSLEDCTSQLQNVCRAGRLGDCVFKDYVQVYEEVYCPFVACTVEGFRENQCDCAFYELYCERLNSNDCATVIHATSDEADKKPFFGCDETELKNVCAEAHTCKDRGDLQGLPDLGTWKGSVTTGIRSSGERAGGSIMVGVTLMSMFWLMVNV
jgi:hypothetical protein